MRFLRKGFFYLKSKYALLSDKKYTTIAGTLVFFLLMSIVPLTFLITLLFGKATAFTGSRIANFSVFESVEEIFEYIRIEATRATSAASVFLVITTLYSSTNLFYQMRKSGELIYEIKIPHKGIKYRLDALVLLFYVLLLFVVLALSLGLISYLSSRLLSPAVVAVMDFLFLVFSAFLIVLLLNAYVCPYKRPLRNFLFGTIITVLAWIIGAYGFGFYLKFSNFDRLYGALSAVIVFLLWLYVMTICFVSGVIFNSERIKLIEKSGKKLKIQKK